MKTKTLVLTLAAASLALGTTNLVADGDQPWHISGQFGTISLDDNRNTRNNDIWWSAGFGRFFGDHFSLDLEYDQFSGTFKDYQIVAPGATYDQWKLSNWGAMARYHIGESKVRPYLAFGVGSLKHRNVGDEGSDTSLSIGGGLAGQFSKHMSGRMQVMYRSDSDNIPPARRSETTFQM